LVELGPNSGVFANYDELDTSNIVVTNNAARGTSATVTWDDTGYSAVVDFDYAAIDIQPVDDEWNSGESIPVILNDQDANLNSRFDEDLDLFNSNVDLLPSVTIGSPLTLAGLSTTGASVDFNLASGNVNLYTDDGDGSTNASSVRANSQIANLVNAASTGAIAVGDQLVFQLGTVTYADLYEVWKRNQTNVADNKVVVDTIINNFNYDIRSVLNNVENGSITGFDIKLEGTLGGNANTEVHVSNDSINTNETSGQQDFALLFNDLEDETRTRGER
jgi:hypothetical protein